ncbi:DNA mismatch repair protein MutS [Natronoarchaeum philippinense]|uniref:DNA mismatch repair protein MutS n=1 Tax=Natronoarchaeum philippinense TaxID=558529 RepID=A0A285NTD9_NATPI|nr:DNA mismatch repair protein MutS [Natronoarchaeum philippinense]SNZ12478.1 DNA mismatch repair protein MutS [Natronoarchaeum philippinense]
MTEAEGIVGEFKSLKRSSDADVLAMQVGDFYEFFDEDAELVGEELDLKTSKKSSGGTKYPMAGVPVAELTPYLKALVERGYRVAVANQRETDSGHVREIERVATPGTLLETSDADARYVAAVVESGSTADSRSGGGADAYGLAFADVTTGRFYVTEIDGDDPRGKTLTELYRFDPVEVLPGPAVREDDDLLGTVRDRTGATPTLFDADAFAPGGADRALREQFGAETVDSVGIDADAAIRAAGAIVAYVEETGTGVLASMTRLQRYRDADHVELDATTQRNLELTETMQGDRSGSLYDTIDHTVTSPGGRLLKEWLQRPRRSRDVLRRRQESVEALAAAALAREELRETLGEAYDLERLASKSTHGSADARDLLAARDTLGLLPELEAAIDAAPQLADSPLTDIVDQPDREAAAELRERLDAALAEDPPSTVREGGMLTQGFDEELDEIIERHEQVEEWFDTLAEREREEYGLAHVSVGRNKTDGYYIQVGKSAADGVPEHYENVKTLKNSERFVTDELEEKEREIMRLEERRGDLEYELFCELRDAVAAAAETLQDVGRAIAEIDALASLAVHAVGNDWTRPELAEPGEPVEIEQGRHPVVEQTTDFVPNGASLTDDRRFLIVTGPNMSGKSTYMRQTALIVLLAQIGSFVPARSAQVGVVDGIYTRVGALDELAQGRSTFMVEMQELSNILHSATDESLVILDEVGRGTATYDGISIAWAATEYLVNEIGARTLFATHYHELTALGDHFDTVANVHVAADETDGEVTFLRTVRDGPTDRSYGIHVADLAGVPDPVVDRSQDVLARLRDDEAIDIRGSGGSGGETKQVVFDVQSGQMTTASADGGAESAARGSASNDAVSGVEGGRTASGGENKRTASKDGSDDGDAELDESAAEVLDELADLSINDTPPVELMAKVQEWQDELDGA